MLVRKDVPGNREVREDYVFHGNFGGSQSSYSKHTRCVYSAIPVEAVPKGERVRVNLFVVPNIHEIVAKRERVRASAIPK